VYTGRSRSNDRHRRTTTRRNPIDSLNAFKTVSRLHFGRKSRRNVFSGKCVDVLLIRDLLRGEELLKIKKPKNVVPMDSTMDFLTLNYTRGVFYTPIWFTQKSMWYCTYNCLYLLMKEHSAT